MTTPTRDLERTLTTWLESEALTHEPAGLSASVMERTAATRQLPGWVLLERWLPMQTTARLGPATRAVILMLTIGLLTALTVGAITAATQRQLPQPWGPAGNGLIAFDHAGDIYVVNPDGTGRRPVVDSHEFEFDPTWSRDGTRLAYWSAERDPWDGSETLASLIVVDEDGSDATVLATDVTFPSSISWSRNGDAIAYSSGLAGIVAPRVYVAATDGSGSQLVGDPELDAWDPAFSPDGWTLAFMGGNHDAERGLFLMDRDGMDVRQLSHETGGNFQRHHSQPRWSPDGMFVAVSAGSQGVTHSRLFRVDGLHEIDLSDQPSLGRAAFVSMSADWSPDAERVAYVRDTEIARIVVADADGSDAAVVEGVRVAPYTSLHWAPDGTRLLATSALATDDAEPGLVVIDPTGEHPPLGIPGSGDNFSWQRAAP